MTHIAIQKHHDGRVVEWMEKVSVQDYTTEQGPSDPPPCLSIRKGLPMFACEGFATSSAEQPLFRAMREFLRRAPAGIASALWPRRVKAALATAATSDNAA